MKNLYGGIDIGGTKIAVGIADEELNVLATANFATAETGSPQNAMALAEKHLRQMAADKDGEIISVGIGCAGPIDPKKGIVLNPPNLPGWHNFEIVDDMQQRSGVVAILDNDANAAALAEHRFGAGRGFDNFIYITVSTGIGGGIIINGKLVRGISGNAGEIGHIIVCENGPVCNCGANGCLEIMSSGTAIGRRAEKMVADGNAGDGILATLYSAEQKLSARSVAEAVAENDPAAVTIWNEAVHYLGVGVGTLIVTLEPEAVVLGGGVAMTGELLLKPLRAELSENIKIIDPTPIKILQAGLGSESVLYGAFVLAEEISK